MYLYNSGAYHQHARQIRALVQGKKYNKRSSPARSLIENNIIARLHDLEISDSSIATSAKRPDSCITIQVSVPQGKPREWIMWNLSSAADGTAYTVEDCVCPQNSRTCTIRFFDQSHSKPDVVLVCAWSARYFPRTAMLAIVVSDFGFTADKTIIEYLSFPGPLTVSLAPSRKLSSWTAQISNEYKKEIAILLPLEPVVSLPSSYRSSYIMVHYPTEKVRQIISDAATAVPHFSGFTNLGGARILGDSRVSDILFAELKKRNVYFLWAPASKKSVAPKFAGKYGVPMVSIDCTVGSGMSAAQIRDLLRRSAREARHRGSFIISTKATAEFIAALKKTSAEFRKNGIFLSYVSDVAFAPADRKK